MSWTWEHWSIGRVLAHRNSLGQFSKGHRHESPKWKRAVSKALKGRIGPRKGCKVTEETKRKLSLAQLGKKHSEETKKKISEANKGRVVSEEHKKKISIALRGKKNRLGYKCSEKTKIRISIARKKLFKKKGEEDK